MSIATGSADVQWVEIRAGWRFSRSAALRLPFDTATAVRVRKWDRFRQIHDFVVVPLLVLGTGASFLIFYYSWDSPARLLFFPAGWILGWWTQRTNERLAVTPYPKRVGRFGIYLPDVPDVVAWEWIARNPGVQMMPGPPPAPRKPSWLYLTGAALSAAAAVGATIIGGSNMAWLAVSVVWFGAAIWCVIRAVSQVAGRGDFDHA